MRLRDLLTFLALTFLIAWTILASYVFMPETLAGWFGALTGSHPLFYLAVWAPALSALMVIAYRSGIAGVGGFLRRFLLLKASWPWSVFLILGVPAVFFIAALLKTGAYDDPFPFPSLPAYLLTLFLMAIKGPVEEIGWRGLALPLLQQRMAPIWAGVVLGIIWGVWHLPAFLISGVPQSGWSFGHFFVGVVALSVIVTPLFNASEGSIMLSAFFHLQLMNPLWPDAQPYDSYFFVGVALIVIWLNRRTLFSRDNAVVEVVPQ